MKGIKFEAGSVSEIDFLDGDNTPQGGQSIKEAQEEELPSGDQAYVQFLVDQLQQLCKDMERKEKATTNA